MTAKLIVIVLTCICTSAVQADIWGRDSNGDFQDGQWYKAGASPPVRGNPGAGDEAELNFLSVTASSGSVQLIDYGDLMVNGTLNAQSVNHINLSGAGTLTVQNIDENELGVNVVGGHLSAPNGGAVNATSGGVVTYGTCKVCGAYDGGSSLTITGLGISTANFPGVATFSNGSSLAANGGLQNFTLNVYSGSTAHVSNYNTGSASIDGSGSALTVVQDYLMSSGSFQISNQGTATVSGQLNLTSGNVSIDGAGSVLTVAQDFSMNPGDLQLSNGGAGRVNKNLVLGRGQVITDGGGSSLTVDQDLKVTGAFLDLSNGAALTVSGQLILGGRMENGSSVGGGGNWTGPNTKITSGAMFVGVTTPGPSFSLSISGGVFLNTGEVQIGSDAGTDGTIAMSGAATTWELATAARMAVGVSGTAHFDISTGGHLVFDSGTIFFVGYDSGSDGSMTLDGNTSVIDASMAQVSIGELAGSKGRLVLTNQASLLLGQDTFIGDGGSGSLVLSSGSLVTMSGGSTSFSIGNKQGSSGGISVQGGGTTVVLTDLKVGSSGNGNVLVQDTGFLHNTGNVVLGEMAGGNGTATITGAGTQWQVDGSVAIGAAGSGSFYLNSGSTVTVSGASLVLGGQANSFGQLIADGTGQSPSLLFQGAATQMVIGSSGHGIFTVQNGAKITSKCEVFIGSPGSAKGETTVSGPGSQWTVSGSIAMGQEGQGTLTIMNGGSVNITGPNPGLIIGSTLAPPNAGIASVSVDGSGSQLSVDGQLSVLTNGSLSISGGAHATASADSSSVFVNAVPPSFASLTVTGVGSVLDTRAQPLVVGSTGQGSLTIADGSQVTTEGLNTLGQVSGSTGHAIVTNSAWTVGGLLVGRDGTSDVQVENGAILQANGGISLGIGGSGNGTVTVDRASVVITNSTADFPLVVGEKGTGNFIISNGGSASVKGDVEIASNNGSVGRLQVSGVNSSFGCGRMDVGGTAEIQGGAGSFTLLAGASAAVGTVLNLWDGGIVDVRGGTLRVGFSSDAAGVGQILVAANAVLSGSGQIFGDVINVGAVTPGDSPGTLRVQGNYTQKSGALLSIEIGGTAPGNGYDQIQVSGAATIAGNLQVRLVNGFTPAVGQTYRIINANSFSGGFSSIVEPSQAGISVSNDATGITVTITSVVAGAPVISSATTVHAKQGEAFSYQITATNNPTSFGAMNLPDGLTVDHGTGLISGTPTKSGYYVVPIAANNDAGSGQADLIIEVAGPLPKPSQLLNISTRMRVLSGDNVLIGGFIITGTEPKKVIIRGIGPSLGGLGISGTLADPTLELHQGSTTLATNDNWKTRPDGSSQQAEVEATTIPPTNDLESAIVTTLNPGTYTAILADKNGASGVGVVEVYDLAQGANSKLANISSRGFVDAGDNVMIGGLIVGGGNVGGSAKVIVRAIGPSLSNVGVSGALQDPTLELHDGNGALLVSNDNWKIRSDGSSQQAEIEATTIPPTNDLESAILSTLAPGNYTAIVRGKDNTTGIGLVEVYNLQ